MGGRAWHKGGQWNHKRCKEKHPATNLAKVTEPANTRHNRRTEKAAANTQRQNAGYFRKHLPLQDVLPKFCPLGRFFNKKKPTTSLGYLHFPPELMRMVLGSLHLDTLLALSKVNRTGAQAVMHTTDLGKVCPPEIPK